VRALLLALARFLGRLGLGRRVTHVDAGAPVHVTAIVVDATTGTPVADAGVTLERGMLGRETRPVRFPVGRTDGHGSLDATAVVRWFYATPTTSAPAASPPPLAAIVDKAGYREERTSFDLDNLPRVGPVKELDLGTVSMARV
jgi:hypothetical protein